MQLDGEGKPSFTIHRPAAYDYLHIGPHARARVTALEPQWIYHGTLHASEPRILELIRGLSRAMPAARRFYDINLRPGCYTPALVDELMRRANVVKLNDDEATAVDAMFGLRHGSIEEFCRDWSARLGWEAVCITRGADGCAILAGGVYAEAPGYAVRVVDTVGSGDAFAAAFLHGLSQGWPPERIGDFANRLGAVVASRAGAVPDWTLADCESLGYSAAKARGKSSS